MCERDSALVAAGAPKVPYTLAQAYARVLSDINTGTAEVPTFSDAKLRHRMIEAIERSSDTGMRQSYAVEAPRPCLIELL